ncbi:hypothetical protein PG996_012790 [Apiospora saccharicola]|uniref:Uncharacterized protein n=1 Tax=Apiospora saccharicola TaxID=335842 RepID=A0ABR1U3L4_9PEZI
MFIIGNTAANHAFNRSGVPADPKSPLYKELAEEYSHMRDPLLSPADDVNFQDFIRGKIMEKAAKRDEEGQAPDSSSNGNNVGGGDEEDDNNDAVPHRATEERKKKSRLPLKKVLRFLFV